jgi:hypothetical protein
MRFVISMFVVLLGATIAWRYYPLLQGALASRPPTATKPIVFDNGTVRQYLPPPEPSSVPLVTSMPPGALRKCVKGKQKIYTDMPCPPGHQELVVSSDRLTVLPSQGSGQGPAKADAASPPGERRATLRDALDTSGNDQNRQRIVDRAVEMQTR